MNWNLRGVLEHPPWIRQWNNRRLNKLQTPLMHSSTRLFHVCTCVHVGMYPLLCLYARTHIIIQLLVLDGEQLVLDPVELMQSVQRFLGLPLVDYSQLIRCDHYVRVRVLQVQALVTQRREEKGSPLPPPHLSLSSV